MTKACLRVRLGADCVCISARSWAATLTSYLGKLYVTRPMCFYEQRQLAGRSTLALVAKNKYLRTPQST